MEGLNWTLISMLKEAFEGVKDQMGPCGITCATCSLGNGTVAETAQKLQEYLKMYGVPSWAPAVPGGADVDFDRLDKALNWVLTYTRCLGCEQGGGPPDCAIRTCSREKGYELCSECPDLEGCDKFDWLGDPKSLKDRLRRSKGKSKKEIIEEAISRMKS